MTSRDSIEVALVISVVILFRLGMWPLIAAALAWEFGWR